MKYLVMECHPGYAVVLDEDGNFLKVANRQYTVGQLVTNVVQMHIPAPRKSRNWMYSIAAMAACLVLILGIAFSGVGRPYASVYIKINPEIRIDVDKQDVVVGLEGINPDGINLIQGYVFEQKDLAVVTEELVDKAMEMGYLQTDGQVTIRLDSQDQLWVEHHTQSISHHLQERLAVTVQVQSHHRQEHHGSGAVETTPADPTAEPQTKDTHGHAESENGHGGHKKHDSHS